MKNNEKKKKNKNIICNSFMKVDEERSGYLIRDFTNTYRIHWNELLYFFYCSYYYSNLEKKQKGNVLGLYGLEP